MKHLLVLFILYTQTTSAQDTIAWQPPSDRVIFKEVTAHCGPGSSVTIVGAFKDSRGIHLRYWDPHTNITTCIYETEITDVKYYGSLFSNEVLVDVFFQKPQQASLCVIKFTLNRNDIPWDLVALFSSVAAKAHSG